MSNQELHDTAERIAKHLAGFRFDRRQNKTDTALLIGEPGQLISLSTCYQEPGKIQARAAIKSKCPHRGYDYIGGSIGFTATRAPHILAGEIKRRLLPDAVIFWRDKKEEENERNSKKEILTIRSQALEAAIPALIKISHNYSNIARSSGNTYRFTRHGQTPIDLVAHLSSWADEVNIEVSHLPEPLAYKVLSLISDYMTEQGKNNEC